MANRWGTLGLGQELALPLLAVATVVMLVLPLPPWLLDGLIAVSIGSGLGLLVFAIYIKSPVQLSTFPGLLLLTTMFRIALNVATARQILLTGDAGHIIETFGRLVVGGNLVVGLVVFSIVAIVQFIVIAKGAERVAEVAARFTLDAMPGKQVSIDSDVRSGVLTQDQARTARALLSSESQMFGAMDGAMKFVKGDVIAGMIIVLVNLVGGILVGIFYHGMTAVQAANRYSILAIGDGLASQLPALLVAMAAGILVTRASNENSPNLGGQIGAQLFAAPRALMVTGGISLAFILIPGFPLVAFLLVGGALIFAGTRALRQKKRSEVTWKVQTSAVVRDGMKGVRTLLSDADSIDYAPLTLELTAPLVAILTPPAFEKALWDMRNRVLRDLGLPFAGMVVRRAAKGDSAEFQLDLHDVPIMRMAVEPGCVLVFATKEILQSLGVQGQVPIAGYGSGYWVPLANRPVLDKAAYPYRTTEDALCYFVASVVQRNAADLLGLQDTKSILGQCELSWPDLTKEASTAVPLPRMNHILRSLLRESVPIRDMRTILQALVYAAQIPNDDVILLEAVRQSLSKTIFFRLGDGGSRLRGIFLGAQLEQHLRDALSNTVTGPVWNLPEEQAQAIAQQVIEKYQQAMQASHTPTVALFTAPDLRWHLRMLLQENIPALAVVATSEMPGQMKVARVGVVNALGGTQVTTMAGEGEN